MSGMKVRRRILGVDFGQSRIGVAISDELGMLAHPLETISGSSGKAAVKRVAELARERDVERIIVGLPKHMNGTQGSAAELAIIFTKELQQGAPCEVIMRDERLTTVAANRALRESGQKTRNSRGVVDQVAAQMILQGYLDSLQPPEGLVAPDDERVD